MTPNSSAGILPRLYITSCKALGWLPAKLLVLHRAVWLGLLDADAMTEITRLDYMGRSGFDDEAWNLNTGLWPWEAVAVQESFAHGARLLVVGAGGGREVIALARQGFQVTACDFSIDLTEACRRNLAKARLAAVVLEMPPNGLPADIGPFDGVLVGRGFYHHIPTTGRRIAFLKACRSVLTDSAPLLLSDFHTRLVTAAGHRRIARVANCVRRWVGPPGRVEEGDWLSSSFQHAFTEEEIRQELASAGFEVLDYRQSPFADDTRLAHALARAAPLASSGTQPAHRLA